jgi:hypothetical protein
MFIPDPDFFPSRISDPALKIATEEEDKKLLKIWGWDPGSEIRDPEKTSSESLIEDPGLKKAPDPGSRAPTLSGDGQ